MINFCTRIFHLKKSDFFFLSLAHDLNQSVLCLDRLSLFDVGSLCRLEVGPGWARAQRPGPEKKLTNNKTTTPVYLVLIFSKMLVSFWGDLGGLNPHFYLYLTRHCKLTESPGLKELKAQSWDTRIRLQSDYWSQYWSSLAITYRYNSTSVAS